MKKTIGLLLLLNFFVVSSLFSQVAGRFFKTEELMLPGTYYYPEHWSSSQWERDIKNMADLGFEFTHFGEFAWSAMEPEEGKYDFSWLDEAVRLAEKYGLKVIMCTPTPTPPAWLTTKHPDVLVVNDNGQTIRHGARQQASWASDTYRAYVEKIVTQLAQRYGNSPAIWGWQIDNEPSHYAFSYEYSENAQRKFRQWLKNKYGTIDKLNDVWGTAFWSQTYNNFEQIVIPNEKVLPGKANPHAMLDYKRYTADECASFINFQNDILRKYISPEQWITTNTMPGHPQVDPSRMTHLDFLTYTRYLVNGRYDGYGDQGFRISNTELLGFNNDYYRNIKGITGVMEIQPGQVNWGKFNPQTYPGAVRLWMYHIFAGGNKLVCHYRFRQPLKGSEQYHYGTMETDGVTVSRTGKEIVQFNNEMKDLRKHYSAKDNKMPEHLAKVKTGMLINPDNRWEMDFQPQTNQWNMYTHLIKYHNTLKRFGVPVDVIEENVDFSAYPILVVPAYQLLDKALVARWTKYVEDGGHLVLTCRTGHKDRDAALWEDKLAGPIYDLIGATDLFFDHLPANKWSEVMFEGNKYKWNNWGDIVTPKTGTEVWARYQDQYYKDQAAVLNRKLGKGTVTYIGVDTDDGDLEKAVLGKIYGQIGKTYDLPAGVLIEWRDGFYVGLNYTSDPYTFPISNGSKMILGNKTTPAAGVVIWK